MRSKLKNYWSSKVPQTFQEYLMKIRGYYNIPFAFTWTCDAAFLVSGHLKGGGATTCFTTSRRRSSASVLTTATWPSCHSASVTATRTPGTWQPAPPEDIGLEILSLNVAKICANSVVIQLSSMSTGQVGKLFWAWIQNTQEIKRMLFNWTKQESVLRPFPSTSLQASNWHKINWINCLFLCCT